MKAFHLFLLATVSTGLLGCTELRYTQDAAEEVATQVAVDYLGQVCWMEVDLEIISAERNEVLDESGRSDKFYSVTVLAVSNGNPIGEMEIYVHDNIRFLGIPIQNNEIAGISVRC